MGLRWPCAERRGGAKPLGAAETGGCQGQRPLWAREHHAKPGFKELLSTYAKVIWYFDPTLLRMFSNASINAFRH